MRRLPAACFLSVLIPACQSSPSLPPVPLHDLFQVHYEGRIAPLDSADAGAFEVPPATATADGGASVSFRASIVEVSVAEALQLLPDWVEPAQPLAMGLHLRGGHAEPEAVHRLVETLTARGAVRATPILIAKVGTHTAVSVTTRTAYVASLNVTGGTAPMLFDPEVRSFLHGCQLAFATRGDGEGLQLQVEWRQCEPVQPLPLVSTHRATLQVPVLLRHRMVGETRVLLRDAFLLGALPGTREGKVDLLCVEVDGGKKPAVP